MEILTCKICGNTPVAEANLIKAEMTSTLAKMKVDKYILLVLESKGAIEGSKKILDKLKNN